MIVDRQKESVTAEELTSQMTPLETIRKMLASSSFQTIWQLFWTF
jgi:hypothetical protein